MIDSRVTRSMRVVTRVGLRTTTRTCGQIYYPRVVRLHDCAVEILVRELHHLGWHSLLETADTHTHTRARARAQTAEAAKDGTSDFEH